MKLPRLPCATCGRAIAAGPVAGRLTKGRIWRHDPPVRHRDPGRPLVSCAGSLAIVDLPQPGHQLEIEIDAPGTAADIAPDSEMALF